MALRAGFVRLLLGLVPFLFCLHAVSTTSHGGWFTRLVDTASDAAGESRKAARGGRLSDLGAAGAFVKNLPEGNRGRAIAASVSDDGHWHLMNGAGERVTVSGSQELEEALKWMVVDGANRDRRLITFYIVDEGFVRNPQFIKILPVAPTRLA